MWRITTMKSTAIILVGIAVAAAGGIALFSIPQSRETPPRSVQTLIGDSAVCWLNQGGCTNQAQRNSSVPSITSQELASMLEKKDFFFVNVHIPYEGEIQDTDAFIPYNEIAGNLGKLPKDKNAKIVLYCRSGRMSERAAQELMDLGYTQVSHLAGGMIDWEKSGYTIIKKLQ